jgi:hypothetical protein
MSGIARRCQREEHCYKREPSERGIVARDVTIKALAEMKIVVEAQRQIINAVWLKIE